MTNEAKLKELKAKIDKVEELYSEGINDLLNDMDMSSGRKFLRNDGETFKFYIYKLKCLDLSLAKLKSDADAINNPKGIGISLREINSIIDLGMAKYEAKRGRDRAKFESDCLGEMIDKMDKHKDGHVEEPKETCKWEYVGHSAPDIFTYAPHYRIGCKTEKSKYEKLGIGEGLFIGTPPKYCEHCGLAIEKVKGKIEDGRKDEQKEEPNEYKTCKYKIIGQAKTGGSCLYKFDCGYTHRRFTGERLPSVCPVCKGEVVV